MLTMYLCLSVAILILWSELVRHRRRIKDSEDWEVWTEGKLSNLKSDYRHHQENIDLMNQVSYWDEQRYEKRFKKIEEEVMHAEQTADIARKESAVLKARLCQACGSGFETPKSLTKEAA